MRRSSWAGRTSGDRDSFRADLDQGVGEDDPVPDDRYPVLIGQLVLELAVGLSGSADGESYAAPG